jgi:hypothetical protein
MFKNSKAVEVQLGLTQSGNRVELKYPATSASAARQVHAARIVRGRQF